MDTLDLARLQFALTAGAHFLFVALTLGLATLIAIMQTRATLTRSAVHERMTRFWGRLYVINYAMGIVTGLVMEFQLGMAWSGLTHFAGNVLGGSLAMETLVAFFVESTFLGLWIFGWDRLNRWAHLGVFWVVTLTAYASAYWVLVANGFMQNPVGAEVSGGVLRLTDAAAVLGNPTALTAFGHVLSASLVVGAFFVTGVSAYHLRRRTAEREFFRRSLRIGVFTGLPALLAVAAFGGAGFAFVQPTKEALFEGDAAEVARLQAEAVTAHGSAAGLADHLPPMGLVQAGAILMFIAFVVMLVVAVPSALLALSRRAVLGMRSWHVVLIAAIPLPFAAVLGGWVFREVGRQPWAVYGLLTTEEALSDLSPGVLRFSLTAFAVLFALLVAVNVWMLARNARRGPVTAPSLLDEPSDAPAGPVPVAAAF
ncbi:cytochrome ubiquinol oxidase subunit I [Planobispora rosea]|uniref:Cytochrome ubiquinol oxidase subunit I n=1 Tax=Planobispora rosea TaxID=35762 RepID=A0A8J3WCS8_PLARO|nr:cytochrome ubiquinol oxidase subunit I [Planobispora rosea]GGS72230.1 cytochrome ubiquinol oxidase subunit I [Planobispora rosea]GIH85249.1 cytochrome ubiquinol oxidase subunit I [Planobispora rosea]